MRKLLLLMTALLTLGVSGAWATTSITVNTSSPLTSVSQISTEKYYVLKNAGRNQYVNVNPATGKILMTGSLPTSSDAALLPYIVRFVVNTNAKSEGDAYQLKFYDGTFLPTSNSGSDVYVSSTMGGAGFNDEGFLPTYNTDYFAFRAYWGGTAKDFYFNGNSGAFCFYSKDAAASTNGRYQIYEATCEDFQEINYYFKIGTITSDNKPRKLLTVKSQIVALPTSTGSTIPAFTSYSSAPTASSDGSAIAIELTESYPFEKTALVDGAIPASAPLYRFHLREAASYNNRYPHYNSSTHELDYTTVDATLTTADYFCFTGNQIDGFQVYNVAAGGTRVMGNNTPAQGAKIAMTESGTARWELRTNSQQGFTMIQTTGGVDNAYLHDLSTTFSYWMSSSALTDAGSGLVIERITFDVTDEQYIRIGEGEYTLSSSNTTTYNSGDAYVSASIASSALTLDNTVGAPSYVNQATTVKYYYTASDAVISVAPANGIYYYSNGNAIARGASDKWGPTWKSDAKAPDGTPLLTVTTSTGMSNESGDIYTGDGGAAMRYTLTAAEGYVITGYTINGTAKGTNVVITPRLRNATTVTADNNLATALSVGSLDLNAASFTLSGAATGHLESLALKVTLAYSPTISYTNPISNGTIAKIGIVNSAKTCYVKYIKDDGKAIKTTGQASGTTIPSSPDDAAFYEFVYNVDERTYYLKELYSNKYLYALDVEMKNSTDQKSDDYALSTSELPASGDKSIYQWTIEDGGSVYGQQTYYICPKLNPSTNIAIWTDSNDKFALYGRGGYNFTHAYFEVQTWEDVITAYNEANDIETKLGNAGRVGYPQRTDEYTVALNSLFTAFKGGTYNETLFNNLKSWYASYLVTSGITKPEEGKAYTIANYAKDGTLRYLYDNNGSIGLTTTSGSADKFVCHIKDGTFIFAMNNGKYLIWKGNGQGLNDASGEATLSQMIENTNYPLTIQKFSHSNATANVAFGKLQIIGLRSTPSTQSSLIVKTSADPIRFDHAGTSNFFDNDFSSAWIITEADYYNKVNLTTDNTDAYASIYLPFPVTIPSGITAYAITDQNGKYATLNEIVTNGTLPKETAAILKKAGKTTNETIYLSPATEPGSYLGDNLLDGTVETETLPSGSTYVLGNADGFIGLYPYTGTNLAKGKAYLNIPSSVKALYFNFGDADAIKSMSDNQTIQGLNEVFDLSGRQVSKPTRGLYIVNGKKVVVK